jgi:hypothetical protein
MPELITQHKPFQKKGKRKKPPHTTYCPDFPGWKKGGGYLLETSLN